MGVSPPPPRTANGTTTNTPDNENDSNDNDSNDPAATLPQQQQQQQQQPQQRQRTFLEPSFLITLRARQQGRQQGQERSLLALDDDDDDDDDNENNHDNDDDDDSNEVPWWTAGQQQLHPPPARNDEDSFSFRPWLTRLAWWCHVQLSRRYALFLLILVTFIWPLGVWSFDVFYQQTDSSVRPLPGSPSAAAQAAFAQAFPPPRASNQEQQQQQQEEEDWNDPLHPPLILLLQSVANTTNTTNTTTTNSIVDTNTPTGQWAEHYARLLAPTLNQYCWTINGRIPNCTQQQQRPWIKVTSYWSLQADGLPRLAKSLLAAAEEEEGQGRDAENPTMTLIQVQYTLPTSNHKNGTTRTTITARDNKARVFALMDAIDEYTIAHNSNDNNNNNNTNTTNTNNLFTVQTTGLHYFQRDLVESTRADIHRMDAYALPVALLLLGWVLPGAKATMVWIIPTLAMVTTCCLWSCVMRVVVQMQQITQFTPTVMMSLSLGMGVDYSLFLLARYVEFMTPSSNSSNNNNNNNNHHHNNNNNNNNNRQQRSKAIWQMWTSAGHVVLISGVTLLCAFLGLCALPLTMCQSIGVGAAVAIASAMTANLLVVPALLHTPIGHWILLVPKRQPQQQQGSLEALAPEQQQQQEESIPPTTNTTTTTMADSNRSARQQQQQQQHPAIQSMQQTKPCSLWYWLARQLLNPYKGAVIFIVVVACLVPTARHATQLESSIAFDLLLPADSPSMTTYHLLGHKWGPGRLHPYRILFDGSHSNIRMTSAKGFAIMNQAIHALQNIDETQNVTMSEPILSDTTATTVEQEVAHLALVFDKALTEDSSQSQTVPRTKYSGISVLENNPVSHRTYVAAKICGQTTHSCPLEMLRLIDAIDKTVTSRDQRATYVTATLPVNPFSQPGLDWLRAARETIEKLSANGTLQGVRIYIQGVPAIEQDAVDAVHNAFPATIILTIAVVFTLTGLFFGSILTPCRSIAGTILTVGFSFGLAVLVYQEGLLDWLNVRSVESLEDNFCWLVPIMAFSIIVGLTLDYDAFLMSRILEFRLEGLDHEASIAAGLHATGGIITAAGTIMAVAFGSLMFSSSPVLYQWSFILTTAVLLDTFVIRTVVVPVITNFAGEVFWWPRQLPPAQYFLDDLTRTTSDEDVYVQYRLSQLAESSEYEPLVDLREDAQDE